MGTYRENTNLVGRQRPVAELPYTLTAALWNLLCITLRISDINSSRAFFSLDVCCMYVRYVSISWCNLVHRNQLWSPIEDTNTYLCSMLLYSKSLLKRFIHGVSLNSSIFAGGVDGDVMLTDPARIQDNLSCFRRLGKLPSLIELWVGYGKLVIDRLRSSRLLLEIDGSFMTSGRNSTLSTFRSQETNTKIYGESFPQKAILEPEQQQLVAWGWRKLQPENALRARTYDRKEVMWLCCHLTEMILFSISRTFAPWPTFVTLHTRIIERSYAIDVLLLSNGVDSAYPESGSAARPSMHPSWSSGVTIRTSATI